MINKEDIALPRFAECVRICIRKYKVQHKMRRLGLSEDELVNEVVTRAWLTTESVDLAMGTVAHKQLMWTLTKLSYRKPSVSIPVSIDRCTVDHLDEVELLLNQLPAAESRIVYAYYFEHKTIQEIGGDLSLSTQRIGEIKSRALRRLARNNEERKHVKN